VEWRSNAGSGARILEKPKSYFFRHVSWMHRLLRRTREGKDFYPPVAATGLRLAVSHDEIGSINREE